MGPKVHPITRAAIVAVGGLLVAAGWVEGRLSRAFASLMRRAMKQVAAG